MSSGYWYHPIEVGIPLVGGWTSAPMDKPQKTIPTEIFTKVISAIMSKRVREYTSTPVEPDMKDDGKMTDSTGTANSGLKTEESMTESGKTT